MLVQHLKDIPVATRQEDATLQCADDLQFTSGGDSAAAR